MKKPSKKYANAQDVLPPALLLEVQKHCQGFIWVPVLNRQRLKTADDGNRNKEIIELYNDGVGTTAIAERMGLCPERIRQIVKQYSERK